LFSSLSVCIYCTNCNPSTSVVADSNLVTSCAHPGAHLASTFWICFLSASWGGHIRALRPSTPQSQGTRNILPTRTIKTWMTPVLLYVYHHGSNCLLPVLNQNQDSSIYRVDGSSDKVQKPHEPPSGYSRAGVKTKVASTYKVSLFAPSYQL
jgi:hypothetical protein